MGGWGRQYYQLPNSKDEEQNDNLGQEERALMLIWDPLFPQHWFNFHPILTILMLWKKRKKEIIGTEKKKKKRKKGHFHGQNANVWVWPL